MARDPILLCSIGRQTGHSNLLFAKPCLDLNDALIETDTESRPALPAVLRLHGSVLLPDKPGELSHVADVIAKENGNVIKLEHNQFISINRNAAVELRITLEAEGTVHKNLIVQRLNDEGYRPKLVKSKGM